MDDSTLAVVYLIFILFDVVAVIIAGLAEYNIKSKYNTCSKITADCGLTGREIAERILKRNDINNIEIRQIKGNLTDNYSHFSKTLNLSDEVYDSSTIAAIAIAAHESGHAIQYKKGYAGVWIRQFVIKASNIVSRAFIPLIILGLILSFAVVSTASLGIGRILLIVSLVSLLLSVICNLATLPVEIDASKRALKELEDMNLIDEIEYDETKSMLKAAAYTYVASLAVSLIYLLRFVVILLTIYNKK